MSDVKLRRADSADVHAVAACVQRAYARYADRLAYPPKPVLADYAVVVRETSTWLLESADGECVGVLVLIEQPDHLLLDNVAVDPAWQKQGLGRRLLEFAEAEARRLGLSEVRLYTNALMTENRALYARIGYQEYDRREVNGRAAVFMRKALNADARDARQA
jgi:N-acetylglutamate synthase-like GNAT family acetyltransferase